MNPSISSNLFYQGNLVTITDRKTNEFVSDLSNNRFWIGASRNPSAKGKFIWNDGTKMKTSYWKKGEPNNVHEECVEINLRQHGKWNDCRCQTKLNIACQQPPAGKVTIPRNNYQFYFRLHHL